MPREKRRPIHPIRSRHAPRLALLVVVVALAACGPAGGPDFQTLLGGRTPGPGEMGADARASSTPPPSPTPLVSRFAVQPEQLKGLTIRIWHPWSGAQGEAFTKLVNDFNLSNPWGVIVRVAGFAGFDALDEQVQAALSGEGLPDLTVVYAYQAQAWESGGKRLVDLQPYVTDPVWGLSAAEQQDFTPLFWGQDAAGGRRTGIPAGRSAALLYYNITWARELGFSAAPDSPQQFEEQACAAAQALRSDSDRNNDGRGGALLSTGYPAVLGWLYAFGAQPAALTGSGYRFDTPQVEQAFAYLRSLYDRGCAWISESPFPEQDFAARQGLFAAGSLAGIAYQQAALQQAGSRDEWTSIPFPSPVGKPAISAYGPSYYVLQSQAEKQLAAWLLLRWLLLPENEAAFSAATGLIPARASSLARVNASPQWLAAAELFDLAQVEPGQPSWRTVRWAVSDAATQLFRYYFTIDQVPTLVKLLDDTANDLR